MADEQADAHGSPEEPPDGSARVLDAREVDGEPFGEIMDALADLDPGDSLVVVNGFEPEPLYGVLADRGFAHETRQVAEDEWRVEITRA